MKRFTKIVVSAIFLLLAVQVLLRAQSTQSPVDGFAGGNYVVTGQVNFVACDTNGKLLVGGKFRVMENLSTHNKFVTIIKGNNTHADLPNLSGSRVNCVVPLPDSTLLVGGDCYYSGAPDVVNMLKLIPAPGVGVDTNFAPNPRGEVFAMVAQPDGKILVGGAFTNICGQMHSFLARLNSDGTLDTTFTAQPNSNVMAIAVQANGRILIGGAFQYLNGVSRNRLGRLNHDGSLDDTLNPAPDNAVLSLVVQPDGKLLVGGYFTNIAGTVRSRLARFNADGSLDSTFAPSEITGGSVYSIALRADGDVIAAGGFTNVSGSTFRRFAQFSSAGSTRNAYAAYTRASNNVTGMVIQPDGKVVIAGEFLKVASYDRIHIARLLPYVDAATRTIDAETNGTALTWTLGGSCPQVWRARFEYSPNGAAWTTLGQAAWTNGGWRLAGLSLPIYQTFYIRVKGIYSCGSFNGSQSVLESTRQFYLTPLVAASIDITSPPGTVVLPEGTTSHTVSGTQTNMIGNMCWRLNGGFAHLFAAVSPWSFTVSTLAAGTNRIVVAGSSVSGTPGQDSVDLVVLPPAPTGVTASDRTHRDRISVSWIAAAGAVSYEVWRNTVNNSASAALITATAGIGYDDLAVAPGGVYYYWVKACYAVGKSAFSASDMGRCGGMAVSYIGDSRSGLVVFDAATGTWYICAVAGEALAWAVPWGFAGGVPVPGDYNGDGALDMAIFDTATGNWYIQTLSGTLIAWAMPWGWAGATPVSGDYNNDGVSDLCVFDGASGAWYISAVDGTVIAWATPWGWLGAIPVAGDYNGDGTYDLCVFDPSRGMWFVWSLAGEILGWEIPWGGAGFDPVPGDYNGDGASDLAMYHDAGGHWYVRTLAGDVLLWEGDWGGAELDAVSGDFDGDGAWDLAVYDEINGLWFIRTIGGTLILWNSPWGGYGTTPVIE